MRLFVRYLLPLLIALPIGFLLLYPQLWRCMRIGQTPGFRLLNGSPGVYVNQAATARQTSQLKAHVLTARNRISRFWGDRRGQAVLIYCPKQTDYEQYCLGGEGAGCSLGTPWGDSFLVLGPEGNNADVIAHELCHDELFARLGWWRVKRQIPVWFNEGLALMVDYRFSPPDLWDKPADTPAPADSFDVDEYQLPFTQRSVLPLSELESTRDFFGGGYERVMLAYQTAADEVSRWLTTVGRANVRVLTDAVASGQEFRQVYRQLELDKRARRTPPPKRPAP
ncbi:MULTISPECIES: hypothetical protein [Spirosoma]|uniref:DUF1570 domain-containing protein n=1 Tax=Spirosoma sordidisoli TaxID=2502893 RepID=A0A4Q2UPP4_9BACT|nr:MULTISPECIES: hypothetical protein [Spirosoma]RYC71444.1 hypothetical protein EQG79_04695 [Spirosoma sordidisoli]